MDQRETFQAFRYRLVPLHLVRGIVGEGMCWIGWMRIVGFSLIADAGYCFAVKFSDR